MPAITAVVLMCQPLVHVLKNVAAMAGIKQSFLLGLCCRVVLGVSI